MGGCANLGPLRSKCQDKIRLQIYNGGTSVRENGEGTSGARRARVQVWIPVKERRFKILPPKLNLRKVRQCHQGGLEPVLPSEESHSQRGPDLTSLALSATGWVYLWETQLQPSQGPISSHKSWGHGSSTLPVVEDMRDTVTWLPTETNTPFPKYHGRSQKNARGMVALWNTFGWLPKLENLSIKTYKEKPKYFAYGKPTLQ